MQSFRNRYIIVIELNTAYIVCFTILLTSILSYSAVNSLQSSLDHIKQYINLNLRQTKHNYLPSKSIKTPFNHIPHTSAHSYSDAQKLTLPAHTHAKPSAFCDTQMSGKLLFALYVVRITHRI